MTPPVARRVRALSIHAGYRCRHTGVCCSSGWDIPVERGVELHLRDALGSGRLRIPEAPVTSNPARAGGGVDCFRPVPGLPHGAKVILPSDPSGRCVFLEADKHCAIHRQLGPEALTSACRDFPRVVTLTPLGVSITLSHYCPTAAEVLFAPVTLSDPRLTGPRRSPEGVSSPRTGRGSAVSVLENPPGFPPSWPYEGLDARDALPPLLRPGVLMDWPSLERWEQFAVLVLGDETWTPEAALDVLAGAAEGARRWTPDDGPFARHFQTVLSSPEAPVESCHEGSAASAWQLVASCVPHRALLPSAPEGVDETDESRVAPTWPLLARPVRRWLAAKAFASWLAIQGGGLRTTVLGLRVALGVLRAEAARGCADAGRTLDAGLLKEAVRRADLLLVHLADPAALAKRLSLSEGFLPRGPGVAPAEA